MKRAESYFGDYKCHVKTKLKDSKGRYIYVDKCLKAFIEFFNDIGLKPLGSCCGHGYVEPTIVFEDRIMPDTIKKTKHGIDFNTLKKIKCLKD